MAKGNVFSLDLKGMKVTADVKYFVLINVGKIIWQNMDLLEKCIYASIFEAYSLASIWHLESWHIINYMLRISYRGNQELLERVIIHDDFSQSH